MFRSAVSALLILTSFVTWSSPAWALRPERAGAEEIAGKLAPPPAAGVEDKWAGAPTFTLNRVPHLDDSAVLEQFNAFGDQVWVSFLKGGESGPVRLGFRAVNGGKVFSENVAVFRMKLLKEMLDRVLSPALVQEIWVPGQGEAIGYPDFKNPRTLELLRSEPVRSALAESKEERIRRMPEERQSTEDPEAGLLRLGFTVGESALLFNTAGDAQSAWTPFAHAVVARRENNKVRLSFSALPQVKINRKSNFMLQRAPTGPAAGAEQRSGPVKVLVVGQGAMADRIAVAAQSAAGAVSGEDLPKVEVFVVSTEAEARRSMHESQPDLIFALGELEEGFTSGVLREAHTMKFPEPEVILVDSRLRNEADQERQLRLFGNRFIPIDLRSDPELKNTAQAVKLRVAAHLSALLNAGVEDDLALLEVLNAGGRATAPDGKRYHVHNIDVLSRQAMFLDITQDGIAFDQPSPFSFDDLRKPGWKFSPPLAVSAGAEQTWMGFKPLGGYSPAEIRWDTRIAVIGGGRFLRSALLHRVFGFLNKKGIGPRRLAVLLQPQGEHVARSLNRDDGKEVIMTAGPEFVLSEISPIIVGAGSLKPDSRLGVLRSEQETGAQAFLRYAELPIEFLAVGITEGGFKPANPAIEQAARLLHGLYVNHGGGRRISVINTDNVPHNGDKLRALVEGVSLNVPAEVHFKQWLKTNVTFHNSAVDTIVVEDPADSEKIVPRAEPAPQYLGSLVIEDLEGVLPRELEKVPGVVILREPGALDAYIEWKLRIANWAHLVELPWLLSGFQTTRDVAENEAGRELLERNFASAVGPAIQARPNLSIRGKVPAEFHAEWMERLENPKISQRLEFIGQNVVQKLVYRSFGTLHDLKTKEGVNWNSAAFSIASILRYLTPVSETSPGEFTGRLEPTGPAPGAYRIHPGTKPVYQQVSRLLTGLFGKHSTQIERQLDQVFDLLAQISRDELGLEVDFRRDINLAFLRKRIVEDYILLVGKGRAVPDLAAEILAAAGMEQETAVALVDEETRDGLLSLSPSDVELGEAHIFDYQNADIGRLVGAIVADPVAIIARDSDHEEALLASGFGGAGRIIVRLDLYPGGVADARAAAAEHFSAFSPRYYRADQRDNLEGWISGILERYNLSQELFSKERALREVESLRALRRST